jgi:hypothetical protein
MDIVVALCRCALARPVCDRVKMFGIGARIIVILRDNA